MSIAIKDHPQKLNYLGPDEFPLRSMQQHWTLPGHTEPAHVHIEPKLPERGIFKAGDLVTCEFAVVLFNGGSKVVAFYPGIHKFNATPNVVWDATGGPMMPLMQGQEGAVKTFTGHWTAKIPDNVANWWFFTNYLVMQWDDGTSSTLEALIPFWASQPATDHDLISYHLPVISSRSRMRSPVHPDGGAFAYGESSVETADPLPIAPNSVKWSVLWGTYAYGGVALPAATSEARRDLDLHHEDPGILLWSVTQVPDLIGKPVTYDPTGLAPGVHKYAVIRTTTVDQGLPTQETHSALLSFPVTFDPNAPAVPFPPDGSVPPDVPPVDPPPTGDQWTTRETWGAAHGTVQLQQFGAQTQWRMVLQDGTIVPVAP